MSFDHDVQGKEVLPEGKKKKKKWISNYASGAIILTRVTAALINLGILKESDK